MTGERVPSGTTLRFGTLVALAVASTLYVFGFLSSVWPVSTSLDDARCQVRADLYFTSVAMPDPDESKWAAYRECMSWLFLPRLGWLVGGVLLLFAVSAAIYWLRPAWRVQRSRLQRLDDFPALAEKLREPLAGLVERAGLAKAPEFLLDPASSRAGGVAFGRHGRQIVCLDAGLVALLDRDRASFDAIVLHELAHIRNGDVPITYATLAVWRAFLAVVLLPYLVTLVDPLLLSDTPLHLHSLDSLASGTTWDIYARFALIAVLAYLARTAVLRSRERYADARVAERTGSDDPYRGLADVSDHRRILRWIAIHPSNAARTAAMRDPKSLLRNGFWEVFGSGIAVQLTWSHTVSGLRDIGWYREGNQSMLVMRLVWGVLMAVLVCGIAWRGAAYLRAGGTGRWTFALPGLALGSGMAVGQFLEIGQVSVGFPDALRLAALLLFVATVVLVTCWAGHCARLLGDRVRGGWGALVAAAIGVLCAGCVGWLYEANVVDVTWRDYLSPAVGLVRDYARAADWTALDPALASAVLVSFLPNTDRVLTAAALALVWLVPLLLTPGAGRRVRFGVLAGVAGGVAWALVAFVLRLVDGGRSGADFAVVLSAWELGAAVVVQVVLAVVVTRRADWVVALLATSVTGVLACLGIWAFHLGGGLVDSVFAARPMQFLPFAGTVAALLGILPARGTGTPTTGERSGRLLLAGVVLVSAFAVVWWPKAPQSAALLPPPPDSVAVVEDEAVNIWIYGGGWDHFMAVMTANNEVFQAFAAADVPRIVSACENVLPPVRAGLDFPKPPGDHVRTTWTTALENIEPGARECLRIYRDGTGDGTLMVEKFKAGLDQLGRTLTLLTEARDRALS